MVAATGNRVVLLLEVCSLVDAAALLPLDESSPSLPVPPVVVPPAVGTGAMPCDPCKAEVLGAISRVPLAAELSVEMVWVPPSVGEPGWDVGELVCAACVDDGDDIVEVDVAAVARSVLCQLI